MRERVRERQRERQRQRRKEKGSRGACAFPKITRYGEWNNKRSSVL